MLGHVTHRSSRGMTLVEVLVTLTIIAGVMGVSLYVVNSLNATALKDEANRMTSAMKYTYSQAAINNSQYRMVLDLDAGSYHTEVVSSALTQREEKTDDQLEAEKEFLTEEALAAGRKKRQERSLFSKEEADPFGVNRQVSYERVQDGVLKPGKLGSGLRILRVYAGTPEPIEQGQAYINFYPNGQQDAAIVVLEDDGRTVSLKTEPLTGRVLTYGEALDPARTFGEAESDD